MLQHLRSRPIDAGAYRLRPGGDFVLVSVDEARALTGLELEALLACFGVERLTRIYGDGRREEALRLPVELLGAGDET